MPVIYIKTDHLEKLFGIFQVKTIEELRLAIESGKMNQSLDELLKIARLKKISQEAIRVERENQLSLIHDFNASPEIAIKITNGEIKFSEFLSPKADIKKTEVGFDKDNNCGTCGHFHFKSNGQCSASACNCGVRG